MASDFYEAFYQRAKASIPDFLFDQVKAQALPLSGANARWKNSGPSIFEKLALPELRPGKLEQLKDADLKAVIQRVDKMYKSARRAKEDTTSFRKAAEGRYDILPKSRGMGGTRNERQKDNHQPEASGVAAVHRQV